MKATDLFKDKNFIECLKRRTFGNKGNYIRILNYKDEIIEENIDKVTYLDCRDYWISTIEGISIFKNLEELNLSINEIEELPKEIGELKKLKRLYLPFNALQSLPKEIGNLENLKVLDLRFNLIKELPSEIGKLQNLEKLDLAENQLQYLSEEILKLDNLRRLTLYKAFDLEDLRQDPKELIDILQKLEEKIGFSNVIEDLKKELNKRIK